jgi:hypothetical protein
MPIVHPVGGPRRAADRDPANSPPAAVSENAPVAAAATNERDEA